jgi:hypothetical protein
VWAAGRRLGGPARDLYAIALVCLREVARAMGFQVSEEPDPDGRISLSYQEFLDAVERLRAVDFPIERDPAASRPSAQGA